MKKFKTILAIVVCAAIVFSLVGCKEEENNGSNVVISSPSATSSATAAAESIQPTTENTTTAPTATAKPTEDATASATADAENTATASSTAKPTSTTKPTATSKPLTKIDVSINDLASSIDFPEAGYSEKILRIEEHTGVYIGSHNLGQYSKIVISYGADANADISIHKIYLKDANNNVIASDYLESSNGNGWSNGVRDIELAISSSYSGDLYLTKDEPGHQIAISAIAFYGSNVSTSTTKPTPTPTQIPQGDNAALIERILHEAQVVTNFTRDNGFTYGNAAINPALNWKDLNPSKAIDSSIRYSACDRLVNWVLYRVGFTKHQRFVEGANLDALCQEAKFQKLTNVSTLQAGDIVFTDTNGDRTPDHVFFCASSNLGGNVYLRYDHGSTERIKCQKGTEVTPGKQPFKETISGFVYGYRPNASNMPDADAYNALLVTPSSSAAVPSSSATTVNNAGSFNGSGGWGSNAPNYRYTPGSQYEQFEFHMNLTVSSRNEERDWNNCYVGSRLPSTSQDPTTYGGVWLGFTPGNKVHVYAGNNILVNNWMQVPLATITLPESMTSAHKIVVVDDGDFVKYYMIRSNGSRYLICSIRFDTQIDMMAVFGPNNKLIHWGHAETNANGSGYFKIWSHNAVSSATNVEIKGA